MPAKAAPQTTQSFQPPRHKRQPDSALPAPEISPPTPEPTQGFAYLQRTMGNQALQRMLAGSAGAPARKPPAIKQRTTGSAAQRERIQRLIGFEIETRIPWYKKTDEGKVQDLGYNEIEVPADAGNAKMSVDNDGSDSIIEYVTDPVSDTQSHGDFEQQATDWVEDLRHIRYVGSKSPPPKQMNTYYPSVPDDILIGFLNDQANLNKVAIQATHGVKLSEIKNLFADMTLPDAAGTRYQQKEASFGEANTAAAAGVMDVINELMVTKTGFIRKTRNEADRQDERSEAMPDVEGLMTLMAHYLVLGGKGIQSYLKNRISLFYKSELSAVRENILYNYAITDRIFENSSARSKIKAKLLESTGRKSSESLFKVNMPKGAKKSDSNRNSITKCGDWIDQILKGTGDPFFNEAKNSWATPIRPGLVDGELAVVLEHRDLAAEKSLAGVDLSNPQTIIDYLVWVFDKNQERQQLGEFAPKADDSSEDESSSDSD